MESEYINIDEVVAMMHRYFSDDALQELPPWYSWECLFNVTIERSPLTETRFTVPHEVTTPSKRFTHVYGGLGCIP